MIAVEEGRQDQPRIGHIIVPADLPGITWVLTWDHLGLRASNTHGVIYAGVRLPPDAFAEIPRGPDGIYRDPAAMTRSAGVGNTALYVGVARAARQAFVQFARDRVPSALGKPIAQTERIQAVAGEIDLLISQAETLLHGALLRVESGDEAVVAELSNIKVAIGRSVIAATQTAVAALGNRPGTTPWSVICVTRSASAFTPRRRTPCRWPAAAGYSASDAATAVPPMPNDPAVTPPEHAEQDIT